MFSQFYSQYLPVSSFILICEEISCDIRCLILYSSSTSFFFVPTEIFLFLHGLVIFSRALFAIPARCWMFVSRYPSSVKAISRILDFHTWVNLPSTIRSTYIRVFPLLTTIMPIFIQRGI